MGEVTKTYGWDSSTEGWTSYITLESNGSVTDQSRTQYDVLNWGLTNSCALSSLGQVSCGWHLTGITFEDMGVPPGATVDYITVSYGHLCNASGDPAHSVASTLWVRKNDTTPISWAYADELTYDFETYPGGWTDGTQMGPVSLASDAGIYLDFFTGQQIDSPSGSGNSSCTILTCSFFIEYTEVSWVSPADTASATPGTDALVWTSMTATKRAHFKLQIASDSGFSSGLSTYYSYADSGFEYWDGSAWQALGAAGMPSNKTGNNVRYTATSGLSGTKYRRVAQTV